MESIFSIVKQLSELGIVSILLMFVSVLGLYIIKVREPYEKKLEEAIEKIGTALGKIAETNERNAALFEAQSNYLRDNLGDTIKSLKHEIEDHSTLVAAMSNKMDLLIVSQSRMSQNNSLDRGGDAK